MKKVISLAIISLIGLLLGSGITFYGLIIGDSGRHSPDNCTKTVRGEVTGYDYITAPNGVEMSSPELSFEYKGNSYVSHLAAYSSDWEEFEVGSKYWLRVNPNDLSEIRPVDSLENIMGTYKIEIVCAGTVICGISIVMVAITIMKLLKYNRQCKKTSEVETSV